MRPELPGGWTIRRVHEPHESAAAEGNAPNGIAGTPHLAKEASSLCETRLWERPRASELRVTDLQHPDNPQPRHGRVRAGEARRVQLALLCRLHLACRPDIAHAESCPAP